MPSDDDFSFAESALREARPTAPARSEARPAAGASRRPKRIKFSLPAEQQPVPRAAGFDPYNSSGGSDRKPAWDRIKKR